MSVTNATTPAIATQGNPQLLVSVIQNAVQAQNLIATNIAKLTAAFNVAFPPPLSGSASWTPGAITSGSTASKAITVPGAVFGNYVKAAFSATISGLDISAYVSSAGNVTVTLNNNTGGTVTLGAGTISVSVTTG